MIDDLSSRVGMIQAVCNGHVIGSATGFYMGLKNGSPENVE